MNYEDLTVKQLLEYLEENRPSPKSSHFIEISRFGITMKAGIEDTYKAARRKHISVTPQRMVEVISNSTVKEKWVVPQIVLTDIQLERRDIVLKGAKLSDAMWNEIRTLEAKNQKHMIDNYGFCSGVSGWNTTDKALLKRGIVFANIECRDNKLKSPLPWMTDEGFELWQNGGEMIIGSLK